MNRKVSFTSLSAVLTFVLVLASCEVGNVQQQGVSESENTESANSGLVFLPEEISQSRVRLFGEPSERQVLLGQINIEEDQSQNILDGNVSFPVSLGTSFQIYSDGSVQILDLTVGQDGKREYVSRGTAQVDDEDLLNALSVTPSELVGDKSIMRPSFEVTPINHEEFSGKIVTFKLSKGVQNLIRIGSQLSMPKILLSSADAGNAESSALAALRDIAVELRNNF